MKLLALKTVPTGVEVLVTATGPASAPAGTVTLSFLPEPETAVAGTPPKLTLELLWKPTPLIVTRVPGPPLCGVTAVTDSVGVNLPLLLTLPAGVVRDSLPDFAPAGTTASI